jgi:DNA-binding response OmpR family regulator
VERILIVEDDERLAHHLAVLIQGLGYPSNKAASIAELDHILSEKQNFDVVVLDRLLAGNDSKSRVPQIRNRWPFAPILILSAVNTPLERAELLNLGVDDYLGKPFMSQELIARLRALMRRTRAEPNAYREIGDLVLDIPKRILIHGAVQETLPAKEFLLLKFLSDDMGRVLSRIDLLEMIWSGALEVETNVVEATAANLRKRLTNLGSAIRIRNSRNVGYWLES